MSHALLRRFAADQRGVSAVEFALLAPVMILLFAAMVVFSQAYMARKRVEHVAPMVADLVSQSATLTRSEVEGVLELGPEVMRPYPAGGLGMRVSSVTRTATGYTVNWSVPYAGSNTGGLSSALPAARAAQIIPNDYLQTGESVVVAESVYVYRPIFTRPGDAGGDLGFLPSNALTFAKQSILRPRIADVVACPTC